MAITSHSYNPQEEFWNILTHGIGLGLSIVALILLIVFSSVYQTIWHVVSFTIYGISLVILYSASTFYHASKNIKWRLKLNIFDHAAIYVLIAGTYTPILLVTLRGVWGWSLFGVIWGLAIIGIILKLFYTGKYDSISTVVYVFMGWLALIAVYPLTKNLSVPGLIALLSGGIFYTIGAMFYLKNTLKFNHAIFHVFVLIGSISHFIMIFFFV